MWLRLPADDCDVLVNMDQVRKIRPHATNPQRTVLDWEDGQVLGVNMTFEDLWSEILDFQEPVEITVEGPQDVADLPGVG